MLIEKNLYFSMNHNLKILHCVELNSKPYTYQFLHESEYHDFQSIVMKTFISGGGDATMFCDICGQRFKNRHGVKIHQGKSHKHQ